jgi:4a-hydroxytetrahydrobiopterin dehydratase
VIAWQPALEAKPDGTKSALEGTPNDDVRFKYIKYD